MAIKKRKRSIVVKRRTTFTDGGNVRIVEQDSPPRSIPIRRLSSSKKITDESKKISGNFKAGKELWKNVPTAIRFAKSPSVPSFATNSDPEVDQKLDEMCYKAFVSGELECRAYTLEEIGSYCGISRERVRQIQDQALNNLRGALKQTIGWELSLQDMLKPDQSGDYSWNNQKK